MLLPTGLMGDKAMIKDVMVHLDGSAEDEIRLDYGQALASGERAHLTGVFTNLLPDLSIAMPFDGAGAAVIQVVTELEEQARKEGDATARRLSERLAGLGVPAGLRRFDETFGAMSVKVAEQSRYADLFIATRLYGTGDTPVWLDLVEAVLFGGGRGLLVVPPGYRRPGPVGAALVAWNGSREAARAQRLKPREDLRCIDPVIFRPVVNLRTLITDDHGFLHCCSGS
jgi:hypothetical protein